MQYLWYTKLAPVIILMHVMAHSTISIRLALCKINTNQRFFEGSRLSLLYLTGSFLIGYMEVRYSLLYYVLLVFIIANLLHLSWLNFMLFSLPSLSAVIIVEWVEWAVGWGGRWQKTPFGTPHE